MFCRLLASVRSLLYPFLQRVSKIVSGLMGTPEWVHDFLARGSDLQCIQHETGLQLWVDPLGISSTNQISGHTDTNSSPNVLSVLSTFGAGRRHSECERDGRDAVDEEEDEQQGAVAVRQYGATAREAVLGDTDEQTGSDREDEQVLDAPGRPVQRRPQTHHLHVRLWRNRAHNG